MLTPSAASSRRIRTIPNGENRKAESAPPRGWLGTCTATTGDARGDGLGLGEGDGEGVGVGEGVGAWTTSWAQRGWGCCCTHTWCGPREVVSGIVTLFWKPPDWSATAPPSAWSEVSRKMTMASPARKLVPLTWTGLPAGAAATLRFTEPCGVGVL